MLSGWLLVCGAVSQSVSQTAGRCGVVVEGEGEGGAIGVGEEVVMAEGNGLRELKASLMAKVALRTPLTAAMTRSTTISSRLAIRVRRPNPHCSAAASAQRPRNQTGGSGDATQITRHGKVIDSPQSKEHRDTATVHYRNPEFSTHT